MHNNKEIISRRNLKNYLIGIALLLLVFSFYTLIDFSTKKTLLLKCYGNALTVRHDANLTESKVTLSTGIFLYSNGEGLLTQIGNIEIGKTKYSIDRTHSIHYSDSDGDGVYTMEIRNMLKRASDNLLENIATPYNLLRKNSLPLYVNITKLDNDLFLFKESDIPLFICKKD